VPPLGKQELIVLGAIAAIALIASGILEILNFFISSADPRLGFKLIRYL
jgi:hypothetical protein